MSQNFYKKNTKTNYHKGSCPNTEKLHYEQMIVNGHVRLPHTKEDMDDILKAMDKVLKTTVKIV